MHGNVYDFYAVTFQFIHAPFHNNHSNWTKKTMSESMRPTRDEDDPKTVSNSEKRKSMRDVENDETGSREANKRARRSTTVFHHCHLTMLQSLYQEDGDEKTWRMIDLFLQRRPLLMKQTRKRSNLRSVHEEAVHFLQSSSASCTIQSPPGYASETTAKPQLSPRNRMFSPHLSPSTVPQWRPNSLGLVCRLLGRKAAAANATLHELAKPFHPLIKATDNHLKGLEDMLDTLRQERLEKHRERMSKILSPSMSDASGSHVASRWEDGGQGDDKIALVESKIRLWRMLAHALEEVA